MPPPASALSWRPSSDDALFVGLAALGPVFGPQIIEVISLMNLAYPPNPGGDTPTAAIMWVNVPQLSMAAWAWIALHRNLAERTFALATARS